MTKILNYLITFLLVSRLENSNSLVELSIRKGRKGKSQFTITPRNDDLKTHILEQKTCHIGKYIFLYDPIPPPKPIISIWGWGIWWPHSQYSASTPFKNRPRDNATNL